MKFKKIYIEIGNICNLHCLFCSLDKTKRRQMTLFEFSRIIENIKPYTKYVYLHVKGEPLMHPLLSEFLDVCIKNEMSVNLTTNATLLSEKSDLLLEKSCIRQINISAHALSSINKNEWNKYLDGIARFIKKNQEEKRIYISLRLWIKNDEINDMIFDYLSKAFNKVITKDTKKIFDKTFISYDNEFEWPSLDKEVVSLRGRCLGTFTHVAVLANGDVVPCCLDSCGTMVLGNIFRESFKDIINGDCFLNIHEGFMKNELRGELCKRCTYRERF